MLNYEFPPLGGGAGPVSRELAETLVSKGHEVDVVTMGHKNLPKRDHRNGVDIYRVPCLRRSQSMSRPHEMASYLPTGFHRSRQLHARQNYDVVHSHFILPTGVIALALNSLYNLPYVITAHGSDVPGYNPDRFGILHRLSAPIWSRVVSGADTIVSPSNHLAELIRSRDVDSPVEVVPNGFDYESYDPSLQTQELILVTSRLFERKGIQYFLEALAGIDTNWEVGITGDGPYKSALEAQADRLGLDVTFYGWIERDHLEELLETAEIFVFPSSHENCPVSLQEGMATGNAVVASKFSGTGEVIGEAGVTVDPTDTKEFSLAINRLLDDPEFRDQLQSQARDRIENQFGWDRIGRRYIDVLEDATEVEHVSSTIDSENSTHQISKS